VATQVPSGILLGALMIPVNHQDRSNTQDSVAHVSEISIVTSHIHHVLSSKRISSSMAPMIDPIQNLRESLTLELEKVLFHSEHLLESLDQEDRIMKPKTSRVMNHNPILQGAMSHTHRRKSGMGD
jgi:hypothetical protein